MSDQLNWFKSGYSDDEGGDCVEVALTPTLHIRDSKAAPTGPELRVSAPAWSAFIAAVQPGARAPGFELFPWAFRVFWFG